MALHRSLLARLHHDLSELLSNPYPGVRVFTDEANIRRFCLVLTPPSGPWKDLSLHFDVELPNGWPASPPMIFSSVEGIKHPNISGNWICCDLLKEQDELEMGYSGGYTPALTLRGLFLQFLTFFSSTKVEQTNGSVIDIGDYKIVKYVLDSSIDLSSHDVLASLWDNSRHEEDEDRIKEVCIPIKKAETVNPRWHTAYNLVKNFECKKCPYNTPQFPIHAVIPPSPQTGYLTPLPSPVPTTTTIRLPRNPRRRKTGCTLDMLPSDLLLLLATYLPTSQDLLALSTAYPRFHALSLGHSQLTHKMLFADELRCFFLRTPLNPGLSSLIPSTHLSSSPLSSPSFSSTSLTPTPSSSHHLAPQHDPPILGIGISFNPTTRTFHSDFDFLSWEAYHTHGVRKSVQKRHFDYFLPLALGRDHFERAREGIWDALGVLDGVVAGAEPRGRVVAPGGAGSASSSNTTTTVTTTKNGTIGGTQGRRTQRTPLYISPPPHPWQTVRVIYRMMNNIVVSLMKTCDGVVEWERREAERRAKRVERRAEREERRRERMGVVRRRRSTVELAAELNAQQEAMAAGEGGMGGLGGGLLFAEPEEEHEEFGLGLGLGLDTGTDALGLLTFDAPLSAGPSGVNPFASAGVPPSIGLPTPPSSSNNSSNSIPTASTTPAPAPSPAATTNTGTTTQPAPQPPSTLLHASERSIISYLHLFHLLLCLSRSNPQILHEARSGIEDFIRGRDERGRDARGKERVGNLGEFIVRVMVVLALGEEGGYEGGVQGGGEKEGNGNRKDGEGKKRKGLSWTQINGPFLEEAITRNVFWCLRSLPVLECLEEGSFGGGGASSANSTSAGASATNTAAVKTNPATTVPTPTTYASLASKPKKPERRGSSLDTSTSTSTDKDDAGGGVTWSERYRLEKTFETSETSLRLIMFQVAFLEVFVGGVGGGHTTFSTSSSSASTSSSTNITSTPTTSPPTPFYDPSHDPRTLLTRLDASYGYPPDPSIPATMVGNIKAIYGVRTWGSFFERVRWRRGVELFRSTPAQSGAGNGGWGSPKFVEMLRKAVGKSAERGYHVPKRPREMHLLWRERERGERVWRGEVRERERSERSERIERGERERGKVGRERDEWVGVERGEVERLREGKEGKGKEVRWV